MVDTRTLAQANSLEVPVFLFIGDSNARGSSDNEATVSYVADPLVRSVNASGALAQYAPRTFTGVTNASNNGSVGPEMEFSRLWRAANPAKECALAKLSQSGAGASKLSLGTITGSIAGNQLTVTVGTVATGDLIYGAGIPDGVYVSSGTGPYTLQQRNPQIAPYFADPDATVNLTIASTTLTKAGSYLSWRPNDGSIWYWAYRSLVQAFAALAREGKRPYLAAVFVSLGANDSSDAAAAGVFNSALSATYRLLKASPYWNARTLFVLNRVPTTGGGGSVATVRTAAASFKGQYRDVRLLDCDSYSKNTADPVHYNLAGQIGVGGGQYGIWSGASAGL